VKKKSKSQKMEKMHLRKGDMAIVISGAHQGKNGKVLKVIRKANRVVIEGVNLVKRHTRAVQNKQGGIVEKEAPIHASNVRKEGP
jgi:large subunit ribosomal protein L24